jgi:RHS repeat-associated protein
LLYYPIKTTTLNRIHNPEGYFANNQYFYYRRDHLGNNHEVWNATANTLAQRTQYYPSGLPMEYPYNDNPGEQPYKFGGKEFIEEHGLDVTDLGNRGLYHAISRFTTMDRFAEKFPWQSPYVHAGNNPVNFVDVRGDSIWVNDNDTKILYSQGMGYEGNNAFVSNTFSFLNAINDNGGSEMLSILSSSKNSFSFVDKSATDKNGNTVEGTLSFVGNQSGGGIISAGVLMSNISGYSKIESTAHELFHGLQHEQGQGGSSAFNEVEANVYSSIITDNWAYNTNYFGGLSLNGLGNETPAGAMYQQSFYNLTRAFSTSDFVNAVRTFQTGSERNASGLYNSYPLQKKNQTRSILQQFYPPKL